MLSVYVIGFGFLVPLVASIAIGWRGGNDAPISAPEFAKSAGFAIVWGAAVVFLRHAIWVFSMFGQRLATLALDAGYWTLLSGTIWLPALMIAYVIRAQRKLRE